MQNLFYHSFIHYKIKEKNKSNLIDLYTLKEIIGRITIRNGGFPRWAIKYIIEDLVTLGLLERKNKSLFEIKDSNLENKIKALVITYC